MLKKQIALALFSLLTTSPLLAGNYAYSNPNYECMQDVKLVDSKTLVITEMDDLIEGIFCPNKKTYTYNCTGDVTVFCQLKNVPQNTLTFFPGRQINYTGGGDTVVFRASPLKYKTPHTFRSNTTSDVGFTDKCPEHAKMVAERLIKQCESYTTNCYPVKMEHQGNSNSKIYCRPSIVVRGNERPLY